MYKSLINPSNLSKIKELVSMAGGASEAFIFATADERLVIKTITKEEKNLFCKILLRKYKERILSTPQSKLVRILGLYMLYPSEQYFIMMENIMPFSAEAFIFDLKGSSVGRYVDTGNPNCPIPGKTLKDENLKGFNRKVLLSEPQYLEILRVLSDDMQMLMELNIMDYSILLGFYEKNHSFELANQRYLLEHDGCMYVIGIIDIFQRYNKVKQSERIMKKVLLGQGTRMSVQPAGSYYSRIIEYLSTIVAVGNNLF